MAGKGSASPTLGPRFESQNAGEVAERAFHWLYMCVLCCVNR